MINVIKKYKSLPFIKTFKNIPHKDYLGLLKVTIAVVGNSSSGIIEAPLFGVPVINIGDRQNGRERGRGIIDVAYNEQEIKNTIKTILNRRRYKNSISGFKSPYGDGMASVRIINVLEKIKLNKEIINKEIVY